MRQPQLHILVIGQTTMEMGRMEWGNIGNFYVVEPFFRELHRVFPEATIRTTLQLSDEFCLANDITSLHEKIYCDLKNPSVFEARADLEVAERLRAGEMIGELSPYLAEVQASDVVIDFSGDIWGENADLLGPDRFEIGLCRNRAAQVLGKTTALMCSSPGPFAPHMEGFAKQVFEGFDLVANRESRSTELLAQWGFPMRRVSSGACPAFLFEINGRQDTGALEKLQRIKSISNRIVGFVVCGFNFEKGPHNRWPRQPEEYQEFVHAVEVLIQLHGCHIVLFSHSNGFTLPLVNSQRIHGSDFRHADMIATMLHSRGHAGSVTLLDGLYSPATTKAMIGIFDMLISGRIHGAVAGFSQSVPTCVIDYCHEPRAHKLEGFVRLVGAERYLANPLKVGDLAAKVNQCWLARKAERKRLERAIPRVQSLARRAFDDLASVCEASAAATE